MLHEGWVIANHILVAFHVAFISSVLALPLGEVAKGEVLRFIFASPETLVSALFMYLTFHVGVAWHEMGHFLTAARLNALNEAVLERVRPRLEEKGAGRWLYLAGLFLRIPFGKADGVKREGLNYYPDAPYNLAVAAAGPRASRNLALAFLPPAALLLAAGLLLPSMAALYLGRLCLGFGLVGLLDFLLADPGKYREYQRRERQARDKAATVEKTAGWIREVARVKERILSSRMQRIVHPALGPVTAPWQFRNCGMGGRHTEKEYPESNISMQEAMFMILRAEDYQEAQEITTRLQTRLKEIIENEEGCRVMGIGLEGGLAPYIEKGDFPLPELRLWSMLKRAIEECGLRPGVDVAIALDPALSELEKAYRDEFNQPDAVGMYLFWRDKAKTVLDRDAVLELYVRALEEFEIPVLSIEDGFSEHDFEGWKKLQERLGDRLFIIGDDLVTTNDATIEKAADQGLSNAALIKANQIGTLYETILAMLVALGKGQELVVSHRSKSPNDDMEAQIALAANCLGLKAGGGANTERLVKYQTVAELMLKAGEEEVGGSALAEGERAEVRTVRAWEEPTNAGIPTVGSQVELRLAEIGVTMRFRGATPLGTSAGEGEAIHLVDSVIELAEHQETVRRHRDLFTETEVGVLAFRGGVDEAQVRATGDSTLLDLWRRAQRYQGKGCMTAVENVREVIAPYFEGRNAAALSLFDIDRGLLGLELRVARRRGKLAAEAGAEDEIRVMQRKQNLGMNAMLSVSLALSRAAAQVQGKELYELLREEMLAIVDRLAAAHGVQVQGTTFDDYVRALRETSAILAQRGIPLHQALRDQTGIYRVGEAGPAVPPPAPDIAAAPARPGADEQVEEVAAFLGRELEESYLAHPHHGREHARAVVAAARAIARREGIEADVDWRVVTAAAWLHDAAGRQPGHAAAAAKLARTLLGGQDGFTPDALARVEQAILLHQEHGDEGVRHRAAASPEARLLYDADLLDSVGVRGLHRTVAGHAWRGEDVAGAAAHLRERLAGLAFAASRELAREKGAWTVGFLERAATGTAGETPAGEAGVVAWLYDHHQEPPADLARRALAVLAGCAEDPAVSLARGFFHDLLAVWAPEVSGTAVEEDQEARPPESGGGSSLLPPAFSPAEVAAAEALDRRLAIAFAGEDVEAREAAIRSYLDVKAGLARPERPFGVANNRIFRGEEGVLLPWIASGELVLHRVQGDEVRCVSATRHPLGTVFSDRRIQELGGFRGEPVDLEAAIFAFPGEVDLPPLTRLRDLVALLRRINECTNRSEANYLLRHLVARLCSVPVQEFLRAKNLQPEVNNLVSELTRFLDGRMCQRLSLMARVLVRNLSGLLGQPNLIDRVWNATIDLAEVHVRGSAIVNELRRSSHHALGARTLRIARAYLEYLETGAGGRLAELGLPEPAAADEEARSLSHVRGAVEQVVADLERLLGNAELLNRLEEWRQAYGEALLRCPYGKSIPEEVETLAAEGIRARNRWSYYHHLRILQQKVREVHLPGGLGSGFETLLAELERNNPEEGDFDPAAVERRLLEETEAFVAEARSAWQDDLFRGLDSVLAAYREQAWFPAFRRLRELRARVAGLRTAAAFVDQSLLLAQLDCLLEEMGYMCLRHVASHYGEAGVDLPECLEIIHACAQNLAHDGLQSREAADLGDMLVAGGRSPEEIANILGAVGRIYHMILRRITAPFERMRERLGLGEEEMRAALANLQRYLHDLNSMVNFADLAATSIQARRDLDEDLRLVETAADVVEEEARGEAAILHLSHREEIGARVESSSSAGCMRDLYGGKGSGLLYMAWLNVPTRDGFVLPATIGRSGLYRQDPDALAGLLDEHVAILERDVAARDGRERRFGDVAAPLLVAVRGGSVFSMPGILDTVLFVGMNDAIAEALAADDPWHAWDSYRRFLITFAHARWRLDLEAFDLVEAAKKRHGVRYKDELPWEALREIVEATKTAIRKRGHGAELAELLAEPRRQLQASVAAVLESWHTDTARRYREIKRLCDSWHTAVVVQEMAFGNHRNASTGAGLDESAASLTGVVSRTVVNEYGLREFVGDFKFSAAGDDLVAGTTRSFRPLGELEELMPRLMARLRHNVGKLRRFMGTDQEVEFTVERGLLSVLQCRTASVSAHVVRELVDPGEPLTRGIGVCGGGFRGLVAFGEEDLAELAPVAAGRDDVDGVLLVVENPTPEDIPLILSAQGLLTMKGGSTAHAAVAVNGLEDRSYSAVMSAQGLEVLPRKKEAVVLDAAGELAGRFHKGDVLTIHGATGEVFLGSRELAGGG